MKHKVRHSPEGRTLARLERVVTVLVEAKLIDGASPPDLIKRLHRLEESVRKTHRDRQTLQVIESGLRLLGDANGTALTMPASSGEPIKFPRGTCHPEAP